MEFSEDGSCTCSQLMRKLRSHKPKQSQLLPSKPLRKYHSASPHVFVLRIREMQASGVLTAAPPACERPCYNAAPDAQAARKTTNRQKNM
jgi:hypothetical protein